MIASIFEQITAAVNAFVSALAQAFTGIPTMFYTEGTGGAITWTFLGTLVLIGAGVGLVYLAYRVIKGLLHRAG